MHNLSDEEMDRLSREAAEQHRIPAPSGNWDKLSALLDKEMPVADPFWKKWVWPLSDLLLLLFVFYIFAGKNPVDSDTISDNIQNEVDQRQSEVMQSKTDSEIKKRNDAGRTEDQERADMHVAAGDIKLSKEEQNVNESITKTKSPANTIGLPGKSSATGDVVEIVHTDEKIRNENLTQRKSENAEVNNMLEKLTEISNGNEQPGKFPEQKPDVTTSVHELQTVPLTTLKKSPDISSSLDSTSPAENKDKIQQPITGNLKPTDQHSENHKSAKKLFTGKKGKWEAGIIYSPDFSQVGNAKAVKNGHNFGITLGYHLDDRWSIQTGAIYSRKNYTAIGNGYQKVPGYNSYDPNIKVNKVQAECYMWEIPLNIRYNFLLRRSQKAFISAGVSSYFMEKEDLHYWYTYNANPRYKAWINEQNSSYWFSVAGISAGFEQYITPSISIQAEPFFRFTLKEVGYGYINLKTMGIFLGVKYSPPPRSIKK